MSTETPERVWFVVLDSRKGRLFEMARTPHGRRHLEERAVLAEQWEEKEHHRPSMMAAKGRTHAAFQHEDEERIRRFAREASHWLAEQTAQRHIEHLVVFCAHPILGPLRKTCPDPLARRLDLRSQDLAWLTPAELSVHPAVAETLP